MGDENSSFRLARQVAETELREEEFRRAVEEQKQHIRNKRSLWDRLFPWKIIIRRKP